MKEADPPRRLLTGLLVIGLALLVLVSFGLGRFVLNPVEVAKILFGNAFGLPETWSPEEQAVVIGIRLPRILAALLVGGALSASGAAYQSMFRNPLVSPEILGVAAGAGFGASAGILANQSSAVVQVLAFAGGLVAAMMAVMIARIVGSGSLTILVLAGVVVGALFNALVSGTQYFANPENTLPEITFWLFGSLARATMSGLIVPASICGACLAALYAVRWPLTVLAAGEDAAQTLGINRRVVWVVVIVSSTLLTATVTSIAGIIGWVGLVVPYMGRSLVGSSFYRLLTVSLLLGAGYLLAVDDVARSATDLDLPLGILTAVVGVPVFVVLLARSRRRWS
jgi:iron complex transport system permease protein